MKHYLNLVEHKEIGKKLKDIEESLLSLCPLIDKYPKTSKVAKKFYPLVKIHIKELKNVLDNDLPFENTKYHDRSELTHIYYGDKKAL